MAYPRWCGEHLCAAICATYLAPEELWARSYAQYLARRSGDRQLLEQIARERHDRSDLLHHRQWSDDDFAPIAEAIDDLFRSLKWIT